MPAHKKDASVRARRNKAASAAKISADPESRIPSMPAHPEGWHSEVVRWWEDVWSSPMAPEWDASDEHNVLLCALALNDVWTAESAKDRKDAMGEFRLQRQSLGLSPYDRRRLEWSIESADEARDRGRQRRERRPSVQAQSDGGSDPRNALRAVK